MDLEPFVFQVDARAEVSKWERFRMRFYCNINCDGELSRARPKKVAGTRIRRLKQGNIKLQ